MRDTLGVLYVAIAMVCAHAHAHEDLVKLRRTQEVTAKDDEICALMAARPTISGWGAVCTRNDGLCPEACASVIGGDPASSSIVATIFRASCSVLSKIA